MGRKARESRATSDRLQRSVSAAAWRARPSRRPLPPKRSTGTPSAIECDLGAAKYISGHHYRLHRRGRVHTGLAGVESRAGCTSRPAAQHRQGQRIRNNRNHVAQCNARCRQHRHSTQELAGSSGREASGGPGRLSAQEASSGGWSNPPPPMMDKLRGKSASPRRAHLHRTRPRGPETGSPRCLERGGVAWWRLVCAGQAGDVQAYGSGRAVGGDPMFQCEQIIDVEGQQSWASRAIVSPRSCAPGCSNELPSCVIKDSTRFLSIWGTPRDRDRLAWQDDQYHPLATKLGLEGHAAKATLVSHGRRAGGRIACAGSACIISNRSRLAVEA